MAETKDTDIVVDFLIIVALFLLISILGIGPENLLAWLGNLHYGDTNYWGKGNNSIWPDPETAIGYAEYINSQNGYAEDGSGPLPKPEAGS